MSREERLIAYVDGELSAADRAAFEAELAADPSLAAQLEQQRRLRERIAAAYAPVLDEPAPERLVAAALAANDRGGFRPMHWAAMAASLVAGVLVGFAAPHDRGGLAVRDGVVTARADLAEALDERLASESGPIRVGLSFRDPQGAYCRTFQSEPDRVAGLACRDDGRWVARTTTAWVAADAPEYRTAGAEIPPAVLAAVDELIAGEPLDPAGERAARARNWTP